MVNPLEGGLESKFPVKTDLLVTMSEGAIEDITRLLGDLTERQYTGSQVANHLHDAIIAPNTRVVVVKDERGRIQGMATGVVNCLVTGPKAWVEDVVTAPEQQGKGFASALLDSLEEWFLEKGVANAHLTCAPWRDAGDMYERRGYEKQDTRFYRKRLGQAALFEE